jgi:hypothetical protein
MDPISRLRIIEEIERTAIAFNFCVFLFTKTGERKTIFESSCENLAHLAYLLAFVCQYGKKINLDVSLQIWSILHTWNANLDKIDIDAAIQTILSHFDALSDEWKTNRSLFPP